MPTQPTHTVTDAAAIVGASASQIRNWCGQFAGHLSPTANPAPGQPRTLTPNDLDRAIDANQVALLVESRFQGIQAQIEQLSRAQAASERQQVSRITTFAAGLIVGMVLILVIVGLFALVGYVGG